MKHFYCWFVVLLCLQAQAQSPVFEWARGLNLNCALFANISMRADRSGNVYTTGSFRGTQDFDPGPGTFMLSTATGSAADSIDAYVLKLNSAGILVWARSFGGIMNDAGTSLSVDTNGNVYCVGTFSGTVDMDPGPGIFNLSTGIGGASYMLKLDTGGNFVWARKLEAHSLIRNINISADGFIYLGANADDTADLDPGAGVFRLSSTGACLLKMDLNGNFIWAKQSGSDKNFLINAAPARSGTHMYISGRLSGSSDFDPGPGTYTVSSNNSYTACYDSSGNFIWATQFDGKTSHDISWITGMAVDSFRNVYTCGYFSGRIDFDPGPDSVMMSSRTLYGDGFIVKQDRDGKLVWARKVGGDEFTVRLSIDVDAEGNTYTAGEYKGKGDFDPDPSSSYILSNWGERDIFTLKLDPDGKFVWANGFGGPDDNYEYNITLGPDGSLYNSGVFLNEMYFDPLGMLAYTLFDSAEPGQLFLHKMGLSTTGIAAVGADAGYSLYPNPAADQCYLNTGNHPVAGHQVLVMNVLGQVVYSDRALGGNRIDLRALAPGCYRVMVFRAGTLVFGQNIVRQ